MEDENKTGRWFSGWFSMKWIWSVLSSLGLVNIKAKMLFLGLDNAGKTTLLGSLSSGRVRSCKPTIRPNCEELILGNITFNTYDLGGHSSARTLWTDYFTSVDVIVYMVDAVDVDRMEESCTELNELLSMCAIKDIPILVLGNKIDVGEAVNERELRERMGLPAHLTTGKYYGRQSQSCIREGKRPIEVFMCSVVDRSGYSEGFRWVAQYVS
ncbi:MAG: GTP-binding protein Sar1 [Promethearchaeota archaeon]